jgi:xylose dehydrogenase (NAD/NADP)
MPRKLNWGILGAARVNERLLPAIMTADNAQLVAIASRRPGAAAATLAKHAVGDSRQVRCYDDLASLIDDPKVEAIYCPLANEEHAHWAMQAIAAGKHCLIEKPMATQWQDIEAMAIAAQHQRVKLMEGFMYRFHPQHARVQALIEQGLIGDVLSARASFSFSMQAARLYRVSRSMANGGGARWDIGPYAMHALRWCFAEQGQPLAVVQASALAKLNEYGADTVCSGVLDFGLDGQGRARFGHFDVSFERSRKSEYEIIGSKGWIKCHAAWVFENDPALISWGLDDGRFGEERIEPSNHFSLEIKHFSDCVLNDQPPLLSLQDAQQNCQAIQAVMQSLVSGRPCRLDQLG